MSWTTKHEEEGVKAIRRCLITGNICGSDTWRIGYPCQCVECKLYVQELETKEAQDVHARTTT